MLSAETTVLCKSLCCAVVPYCRAVTLHCFFIHQNAPEVDGESIVRQPRVTVRSMGCHGSGITSVVTDSEGIHAKREPVCD